ncbi:hypothetical protein AMECASPLE_037586 [Ameca splendens]|uniref:Uncharacterized protein n=1 Tax=Ameca splendens TaxID=208324 RepID=A0ABV0Z676_9TELE
MSLRPISVIHASSLSLSSSALSTISKQKTKEQAEALYQHPGFHPSTHFLYPLLPYCIAGELVPISSGGGDAQDKQPFTRKGNLERPVNLTVMLLDCGRKPEYPERTIECTGRTCTLHAERPPARSRTQGLLLAAKQQCGPGSPQSRQPFSCFILKKTSGSCLCAEQHRAGCSRMKRTDRTDELVSESRGDKSNM